MTTKTSHWKRLWRFTTQVNRSTLSSLKRMRQKMSPKRLTQEMRASLLHQHLTELRESSTDEDPAGP